MPTEQNNPVAMPVVIEAPTPIKGALSKLLDLSKGSGSFPWIGQETSAPDSGQYLWVKQVGDLSDDRGNAIKEYLTTHRRPPHRISLPLFLTFDTGAWEADGFDLPSDFLWKLGDQHEPLLGLVGRMNLLAELYYGTDRFQSFREFAVGFVRRKLGLNQDHHSAGTDTMTALVSLRRWCDAGRKARAASLPAGWLTPLPGKSETVPACLRKEAQNGALYHTLFPAAATKMCHNLGNIVSLLEERPQECPQPSTLEGEIDSVDDALPRWKGLGLLDFLAVVPNVLVVDDEAEDVTEQLSNLRLSLDGDESEQLGRIIHFTSAFERPIQANYEEHLISFLTRTSKDRSLRQYDAVLLDLSFGSSTGVDQDALGWRLLPLLRRFLPDIPIIVHSSYGDATQIRRAYEKGADWFLKKDESHKLPSRLRDLLRTSLWRKEWNAMGKEKTAFDPPLDPSGPLKQEEKNRYLWRKAMEHLPGDTIRIQKLGDGFGGAVTVKAWKRVGEIFDLMPPMIVKIDDHFPMSMEYERYQRFVSPFLSNRAGRIERRAVRAGYGHSAIGYTCAGSSQGVVTAHAHLEIVNLNSLLEMNLGPNNAVVIPSKHYSHVLDTLLCDILPRLHNVPAKLKEDPTYGDDYPNAVFGEFNDPLSSYLARFPASHQVTLQRRLDAFSNGTGNPLMIIEPNKKESLIQALWWDESNQLRRIDLIGPMAEYYINARHLRRYQIIRLNPNDKPLALAANGWEHLANRLEATAWNKYATKPNRAASDILAEATAFVRENARAVLDGVRTGIIHGDLNLGNIMVEHEMGDPIPANGEPWLIDFAWTRRDAIVMDYAQLEMDILLRLAGEHAFPDKKVDRDPVIAFRNAYLNHPWMPPAEVSGNEQLAFLWTLMNQVRCAAEQVGVHSNAYKFARLLALMVVAKILLKKNKKFPAVLATLWIEEQHRILAEDLKRSQSGAPCGK